MSVVTNTLKIGISTKDGLVLLLQDVSTGRPLIRKMLLVMQNRNFDLNFHTFLF